MNPYEMLSANYKPASYTFTSAEINDYFYQVSSMELDDQIALELTPNDDGTYTTKDNLIIYIVDDQLTLEGF